MLAQPSKPGVIGIAFIVHRADQEMKNRRCLSAWQRGPRSGGLARPGQKGIETLCILVIFTIMHIFLLGAVTTALVFGAYFLGYFQGQPRSVEWREFFAGMRRSLTWRGFAWSLALPTFWILLYSAFIAQVRFALGRWPKFGENLAGWPLTFHYQAVQLLMGALVCSLFAVPVIAVVCAFLAKWKHVSVYSLCYAAGVGVAWGALFLAPHPFLNWLFD